jgi:hypothetical protein
MAFAAAAFGLGLAFLLASRHPHTGAFFNLPTQADTVVVLDVSASISTDTFSRIGGTLATFSRSGARVGLVVFSDQAYEALPPGSPASDLRPLVRYFTLPRQQGEGVPPQFPANPWTRSFTGGTKISAGLTLAHDIAVAGGVTQPAVVLVSDLDDDPQDVRRLGAVLFAYRRDAIPVQVVALDPSAQDRALFTRILGRNVVVHGSPATGGFTVRSRTPFPWALVGLALLAAAALAVEALWSPRLEWGGRTA